MSNDQTEANLELLLDWINALRHREIDSIEERFHPDVVWVAVSGVVACEGRQQVLDWLRAAPQDRHLVNALEFVANDTHAALGIANAALQELAGVRLDGQLYVVFTIRDGQVVHIHDHARRAQALAQAGIADHHWR
jgi:ketosteroid isomerase-like protein